MYVNKKYYICSMKKIIRLVNILDEELIDKLILFDRLVRFYSIFLRMWKKAEVTSNGRIVRVKFSTQKHGFESFTERVFPIEDIEKRICSYQIKIKKEFALRHDNPRIQRMKTIRMWKNYIREEKFN